MTEIDRAEIPIRVAHVLRYYEISTFEELAEKTQSELMMLPNIGKVTVREIKDMLSDRGLRLATSPGRCPHCGQLLR